MAGFFHKIGRISNQFSGHIANYGWTHQFLAASNPGTGVGRCFADEVWRLGLLEVPAGCRRGEFRRKEQIHIQQLKLNLESCLNSDIFEAFWREAWPRRYDFFNFWNKLQTSVKSFASKAYMVPLLKPRILCHFK